MSRRDVSHSWLATAVVASVVLVVAAPFVGQLRTAIRQSFGPSFATTVGAAVAAGIGFAFVYALARIRDRLIARYGALAAALAVGVGYALAARTGNPEVDAVERFHFVEYGLVTFLFYRAWRPAGAGALIWMPVLAAMVVGTGEEWLQWFIPARVGEARDVLLNLIAIGCGLLFSLGLDPPPKITLRLAAASRRRVASVASVALVIFGAFFHTVHLGYEIHDAEAGVFRSRYTAQELAEVGDARAARWATNPPLTWSRLSQEDQYLSEGVSHVQRRNETWDEGNVMASRQENLILEKYYAPVLDTPSYISAQGHRWPPEQRADAESRSGPGYMIYVSDAEDYPILVWPKWIFWLVIAVLLLPLLRVVWTS